MRKLEIPEIIKRHMLWIKGVNGGQPADLSLRDLRKYKFDRINLRKAKLAGANMSRCSVRQADPKNDHTMLFMRPCLASWSVT